MKSAVRRPEKALRSARCRSIPDSSKNQHRLSERPDGPFLRLTCRQIAQSSELCKSPVFGTFDKNRQFFRRRENGDFRHSLCAKLCFFVRNVYKYALFGFYARWLRNFYRSTKGVAQNMLNLRKNSTEIKKNQEIKRKN